MRQITDVLLIVISLSLVAVAQTASPKAKQTTNENGYSSGYIFAAPGGTSGGGGGTLHIGGGAEGVLKNGAGMAWRQVTSLRLNPLATGLAFFPSMVPTIF